MQPGRGRGARCPESPRPGARTTRPRTHARLHGRPRETRGAARSRTRPPAAPHSAPVLLSVWFEPDCALDQHGVRPRGVGGPRAHPAHGRSLRAGGAGEPVPPPVLCGGRAPRRAGHLRGLVWPPTTAWRSFPGAGATSRSKAQGQAGSESRGPGPLGTPALGGSDLPPDRHPLTARRPSPSHLSLHPQQDRRAVPTPVHACNTCHTCPHLSTPARACDTCHTDHACPLLPTPVHACLCLQHLPAPAHACNTCHTYPHPAHTCPHLSTLAHACDTCPHLPTPARTCDTCLHLPTPAHTCPHLPATPAHACPHLSTPACTCDTYLHLPTPAHACPYLPAPATSAHTCPRLSTPAHACDTCPYLPTPAHTCPHLRHLPTPAHACPRLPAPATPAHTCSHLPTGQPQPCRGEAPPAGRLAPAPGPCLSGSSLPDRVPTTYPEPGLSRPQEAPAQPGRRTGRSLALWAGRHPGGPQPRGHAVGPASVPVGPLPAGTAEALTSLTVLSPRPGEVPWGSPSLQNKPTRGLRQDPPALPKPLGGGHVRLHSGDVCSSGQITPGTTPGGSRTAGSPGPCTSRGLRRSGAGGQGPAVRSEDTGAGTASDAGSLRFLFLLANPPTAAPKPPLQRHRGRGMATGLPADEEPKPTNVHGDPKIRSSSGGPSRWQRRPG
ncbi:mucin-1-like [Vulpes lagopus]|uniref:mucin-1-like n=1 Tax=Vulpes lagopus TaxID=494514 RepID=UPI001BC97D31|nr:mucin-1-like [Vulpes lagopus]